MRLDEFRNKRPSEIGSGITSDDYKGLVHSIKKRMKAGEPKANAIKNEILHNWKDKKVNIKKLTRKIDLDDDIV